MMALLSSEKSEEKVLQLRLPVELAVLLYEKERQKLQLAAAGQ